MNKMSFLLSTLLLTGNVFAAHMSNDEVSINARDRLMHNIDTGNSEVHYKTLKLLLDDGANVNYQDIFGQTALLYCIRLNNFHNIFGQICLSKSMQLLLTRGANPNIQDYAGLTPLHQAIKNLNKFLRNYGHRNNWRFRSCLEIIEVLLKYGADIKIKDGYGKTPLDYLTAKFQFERYEGSRLIREYRLYYKKY